MKKQTYLIFIFILLFSSISFALTIEYPNTDYIKQNMDTTFNFKVYNDNYILLDNTTTSCNLNLYKSNGTTLYETTTQGSFYVMVSKTNFSELGKLYYSINCNTSTDGGFVNKDIEVTTSGRKENDNIIALIIAIGIIGAFFLIIANLVDEKKHFILKLMLVIFSLITLMILPQAFFNMINAPTTILKLVMWSYRVFGLYVFAYLIYEILKWLGVIVDETAKVTGKQK